MTDISNKQIKIFGGILAALATAFGVWIASTVREGLRASRISDVRSYSDLAYVSKAELMSLEGSMAEAVRTMQGLSTTLAAYIEDNERALMEFKVNQNEMLSKDQAGLLYPTKDALYGVEGQIGAFKANVNQRIESHQRDSGIHFDRSAVPTNQTIDYIDRDVKKNTADIEENSESINKIMRQN